MNGNGRWTRSAIPFVLGYGYWTTTGDFSPFDSEWWEAMGGGSPDVPGATAERATAWA